MQVFTSATLNYLPKARVLAATVKRHHPEARFHLVLSDRLPESLKDSPAPFDAILHVEQLPIENIKAWIFKHTLVELCTAVKGFACQAIMDQYPGEPVLYLDPDIVVLSPLDDLLSQLDRHDVLLTPHLVDPEDTVEAMIAHEICALQHGVYNLGFLGLAPTAEARRFVDWWAERLRLFCHAEIGNGLFTDQRWADLAPAFFRSLGILRDAAYNVATWNLTHRLVTGSLEEGLKVNGQPLCFFHFSGFDRGDQKVMLDKFGSRSPVLYQLRQWYIDQCRQMGQDDLGDAPWAYAAFQNGKPITPHQRRLYRSRQDLQQAFPDPVRTDRDDFSYYRWYQQEIAYDPVPDTKEELQDELLRVRRSLKLMVQTNQLLSETNNTLTATSAALTGTNTSLTTMNHSLAAANQALVASNHACTEMNAKLQEELEATRREMERIQRSRSYRAARRVAALVQGAWPRSA
jgi:hypothetical protein